MATQRPKRRYNCTQAELYAICTIGWQSYQENLTDFENFSTLYTAATATNAFAAIESAKVLPDFQARNEATETAYIQMGLTAEQCLTKWRTLRSYIKAAFPPELHKPKIEAAGEDHYNKATARNWGETQLMLTSALSFITDNTAELTAGGMPATFQTDVETLQTEFTTHYNKFTDSGQDEHEGTDAKIIANNAIYDTLQRMFEDGQIIYEKDPAKRDRFIFQRVKDMITTPPGGGTDPGNSSDIKVGGTIVDANTLLPIPNASVVLTFPSFPDPLITQTDSEGKYIIEVNGVPNGETFSASMEASAPNYELNQTPVELTADQSYTIDFSLNPISVP